MRRRCRMARIGIGIGGVVGVARPARYCSGVFEVHRWRWVVQGGRIRGPRGVARERDGGRGVGRLRAQLVLRHREGIEAPSRSCHRVNAHALFRCWNVRVSGSVRVGKLGWWYTRGGGE